MLGLDGTDKDPEAQRSNLVEVRSSQDCGSRASPQERRMLVTVGNDKWLELLQIQFNFVLSSKQNTGCFCKRDLSVVCQHWAEWEGLGHGATDQDMRD